jgi:hypothetical protein
MISSFFDWCGRNIEWVIWFNVILLFASALEQVEKANWYPLGLCSILVVVIGILKK